MSKCRTWPRWLAVLYVSGFAAAGQAAYPDRPITIIVPWGAGGAADALARSLGGMMEADLKVPINVVNRTGGSGVVGHHAIVGREARRLHVRTRNRRDRDVQAPGARALHAQGLHADRDRQHRRGRTDGARSDSPYQTAKQLIDDIKVRPPAGDQGVGHRAGRHLAPGPRRLDARRGRRSRQGAVGAESGVGARDAGPGCRRRRFRHRVTAGRPHVHRGRAGPCAREHGQDAPLAIRERTDAQGSDRLGLDDPHLACVRRAEGPSARRSSIASRRYCAARTRARCSRTS